jgi:hypothetical protein
MADLGPGQAGQIVKAHAGRRSEEPTVRSDDEHTALQLRWRAGECFGIRQLAAEVEAGEEAKHLAKGRAFTRMESPRKREHGRWTKEQACTLAVQTGR